MMTKDFLAGLIIGSLRSKNIILDHDSYGWEVRDGRHVLLVYFRWGVVRFDDLLQSQKMIRHYIGNPDDSVNIEITIGNGWMQYTFEGLKLAGGEAGKK